MGLVESTRKHPTQVNHTHTLRSLMILINVYNLYWVTYNDYSITVIINKQHTTVVDGVQL